MPREYTNDLTGTKVMPHDAQSECAIISLCLKNIPGLNDVVTKALISDDFYDERNARIFAAITKLYLDSAKIDVYTVNDYLKKTAQIEKAGGQKYILDLTDTMAIPSNIEQYCDIVREKSLMRRIIKTLGDTTAQAYASDSDVNAIVETAISKLSNYRDDTKGVGFERLGAILKRNVDEIALISSGKVNARVYKTGYRQLDRMLGGLRPGTLNILAARPGMGKTSLVLNIATNAASMYRQKVNIFSLEMSKQEIANRITASLTDFSSQQLQKGKLSQDELVALTRIYHDMSEMPIYVDDNATVTPISMLAKCKELKSRGELGLVIVDYLQLMTMPGKGNNYSRQQEISDISRHLKLLAKELEVPVIALSQLSRGAEKREDHTPMLSDLRDSGAIEQDADSVWFIDRDSYYDKEHKNVPSVEAKLVVAKNRHGGVGTITLIWRAAKTQFLEPDREGDSIDPRPDPSTFKNKGAQASDYKFDDEMLPPVDEPVAERVAESSGESVTRMADAPENDAYFANEGPMPDAFGQEPPPEEASDFNYTDNYSDSYSDNGGDNYYEAGEEFESNPANDDLFGDEVSTDFPEDMF